MRFAKKLRKGIITDKPENSKTKEIVLLLDNVYDTFNVGGMYRVADAAGVSKIYHCGKTPVPPNPKISRSAVGLDKYIPNEYKNSIITAITELQKTGYVVVVLEQSSNSKVYDDVDYLDLVKTGKRGIALISGNETFGVTKEVIEKANLVVELPMYGVNKSLNVVVSTGIVLYEIRRKLNC
jgi:23S rRNA (guanosine2251-2'-O)-methyltransferase